MLDIPEAANFLHIPGKSGVAFVYRSSRDNMPSADQVKALISSLADGDEAQFYSVAMQIAAHEAHIGHTKLAQELRSLIDRAKSKSRVPASGPIPLARPRGEVAELLSVSYPRFGLATWCSAAPSRKSLIA